MKSLESDLREADWHPENEHVGHVPEYAGFKKSEFALLAIFRFYVCFESVVTYSYSLSKPRICRCSKQTNPDDFFSTSPQRGKFPFTKIQMLFRMSQTNEWNFKQILKNAEKFRSFLELGSWRTCFFVGFCWTPPLAYRKFKDRVTAQRSWSRSIWSCNAALQGQIRRL